VTPTPEASEREAEAELRRHMAGEYASDAEDKAVASFRTAVRAALVAEIVAGVEEAIRKLPEPNLSQDDKVRYAFAGKMAAFAIVLDNLRPTETDNGKL
jgi:hypothetical protein